MNEEQFELVFGALGLVMIAAGGLVVSTAFLAVDTWLHGVFYGTFMSLLGVLVPMAIIDDADDVDGPTNIASKVGVVMVLLAVVLVIVGGVPVGVLPSVLLLSAAAALAVVGAATAAVGEIVSDAETTEGVPDDPTEVLDDE